jgi:hypothetical protein
MEEILYYFVLLNKNGTPEDVPLSYLLLAEGLTVSTLICSGVCFVGTHLDSIQRAVVIIFAVIGTLLNSAGNALVCTTAHCFFLLFFQIHTVCPDGPDSMYSPRSTRFISCKRIDNLSPCLYNICGKYRISTRKSKDEQSFKRKENLP